MHSGLARDLAAASEAARVAELHLFAIRCCDNQLNPGMSIFFALEITCKPLGSIGSSHKRILPPRECLKLASTLHDFEAAPIFFGGTNRQSAAVLLAAPIC